jgi:hypothetical protein
MQTIDEAIEWICGLHVGVVGQGRSRHEKEDCFKVLDSLA